MSLTSKIFVDGRYTKNDGTQAIKIRLTIDRETLEIPTGYTVNPDYWNDRKMEIKPGCPSFKNVTRLNNMLKKQRIEFEDKIIELQNSGTLPSMSMKNLKMALIGKANNDGILAFSLKIIAEMEEAKRFGNARVYRTLYRSIKNFQNDKELAIKSLNFQWLKAYEAWYLGKGNTANGLSVHMRTLRALLNRAISEGLLSKDVYPFENYSIKTEKTKKRAISEEDIQKIKDYVPDSDQRHRAKDFFFMSYYLMGASFVDLAYMKINQIQNGRIEYKRKKTGQLYNIKITPPLQVILDKYTFGKSQNEFLLNVITTRDEKKMYDQVRDELRRYNKRIKEIALSCGVQASITSYVARHSFATIAKLKGIPVPVISQALGHEDSKTTEIYLAQFDHETMDAFNEQIIGK